MVEDDGTVSAPLCSPLENLRLLWVGLQEVDLQYSIRMHAYDKGWYIAKTNHYYDSHLLIYEYKAS